MEGKARAAAERALELDPELPEAHTALGLMRLVFDWDWPAAESSLLRAIELRPGSASAHAVYGVVLPTIGRLEDGLAELGHALELDPLSFEARTYLGLYTLSAGKPDDAIRHAKGAIELEPGYVLAHVVLARGYCMTGRTDEAVASFEHAISLSPGDADIVSLLASCHAASGSPEKARRVLGKLQERAASGPVSPVSLARVHARLGENDAAFASLEAAYEERWPDLNFAPVDPDFTPLRGDPRFADLLRRIHVPED